jgi:hypothetical protein
VEGVSDPFANFVNIQVNSLIKRLWAIGFGYAEFNSRDFGDSDCPEVRYPNAIKIEDASSPDRRWVRDKEENPAPE